MNPGNITGVNYAAQQPAPAPPSVASALDRLHRAVGSASDLRLALQALADHVDPLPQLAGADAAARPQSSGLVSKLHDAHADLAGLHSQCHDFVARIQKAIG